MGHPTQPEKKVREYRPQSDLQKLVFQYRQSLGNLVRAYQNIRAVHDFIGGTELDGYEAYVSVESLKSQITRTYEKRRLVIINKRAQDAVKK